MPEENQILPHYGNCLKQRCNRRRKKMKIKKGTESLFEQDKEDVLTYLKERHLDNEKLKEVIRGYPFGLVENAKFLVNNEPYEITHFLSKSSTMGYDIRKVNELLGLQKTDDVVIAVVLGDDALCCNVKTGKVFLWLVQTGDGKKVDVSDDLTAFLNKITKTED